jgi:hypothetical protein
MRELWRKLMFLAGRRRRFESDLDEEMQYHAEMAGRPQFGNMTLLKTKEPRRVGVWLV